MVINQAVEVLRIEAEGVLNLIDRLDENFVRMVDLICALEGRVIISGIGKSGLVGRKIVATLNSTGTNSIFLHPVEAMHGDLGMVGRDDIFLAISNSGETDELNVLIPSIRRLGCSIVAFTGNKKSTLANHSDVIIDVGVEKEACPLGLAPTSSTTAVLAMGDALAVVLITKKHFKSSDFRKFHPGGALGQRLSNKVQDIMLTGEAIPWVYENTPMKDAIPVMDRLKLGVILILKRDKILNGIITDGDIRHFILQRKEILNYSVNDIMTRNPRAIEADLPVYDALNMMEHHQITVLPVIDRAVRVQGILHLHDILGKGAFKFNGA